MNRITMRIIYFVDNKLGGVSSLNYNLTSYAGKETKQWVIHLDQDESEMSRADIRYPVDKELFFKYSNHENYYQTLNRLRKLIPAEEGVMVLNYENEMAMLDHYPVKQTIYQLVHDEYNVRLSQKYGYLADTFICHNTAIHQKLLALMPDRKNDIFYLKHGVPVPENYSKHDNADNKLRLLFLGRMTASKGVFDLPVINDLLREKNIEFEWTCIGNGPELESLKAKWNKKDKVTFVSPQTNKEVIEICCKQDVFVLPTKFEGTPVSLLETMSAAVVPVITNLPGSIPEIVTTDIGYCIPLDDNNAFANAIADLYADRDKLKRMSINCRNKIIAEYELSKTAGKYHELFSRYKEFYKQKKIKKQKVGSRLDHPYLPETVTKLLRKYTR